MVQLTYNLENWIGDGCDERTDAGSSEFGRQVIREMPPETPSAFLAVTVLAVNLLGDGLRDLLDPRIRRQI
jgi:hypothetical protein